MKIITSNLLAIIMIFLFSIPQYSIGSNNLPDTTNRQTGSHFSKENLGYMIIAQRQRRPGTRGKMPGPRRGIRAGQQRGPALNRGPERGNRRQGGRPLGGNRRQMGKNGSQAPMGEGATGVSEMQSDQSMGQVEPGSRRSPKFRKKMRNKMRNKTGQRMRQQKTMRMQQRSKNAADLRQKNRRTMRK